jgi:UDP-N-acetylglucosamine pyrophosphorylase
MEKSLLLLQFFYLSRGILVNERIGTLSFCPFERLFLILYSLSMVELTILNNLAIALKNTKDLGEKQELLLALPHVASTVSEERIKPFLPGEHDLSSKIAVYSIIAIQQHPILFSYQKPTIPREKIKALVQQLVAIDRFYEGIGGIVGYQVYILKLLEKNKEKPAPLRFSRAPGIDLSTDSKEANQAIIAGIKALDELGEIYPIGGLGTRLKLLNKKGKPLPAACLSFCGRSLLEGLVRDVQAREFLYFRLFQRQVTVPIAMMTSQENENAKRIEALCRKKGWFGRPKENFFLFSQLSVPVVTQDGNWSLKAPLELNVQPGGHGALWKAADENGVFIWLQGLDKKHLLIRQINNPIAGLDFGLLALVGIGKNEKKAFGFASCERLPDAAEGVLVLVEEEGNRRLSNIEYTDFKRYGIEDLPTTGGYSLYPANTNILYANLSMLLSVIKKNPLPGLILNMKNKEPFISAQGLKKETIGGRLESMMQNISDALYCPSNQAMATFLTYNARKKTISATKKSYIPGEKLLETPEGAFYDLLLNAYELLRDRCGASLPPFCSQEEYLAHGPTILFVYHPALGPLYSLIAQKIKNPQFDLFSELQLEIADVYLENLRLKGSLLIQAENLLGHNSHGLLRYSNQTGKCILKNVSVANKGINRKWGGSYWKNQIKRHESMVITLEGHSEFYAENVIFQGNQRVTVPPGERWVAEQGPNGAITYRVEKPSWQWNYREENDVLKFSLGS